MSKDPDQHRPPQGSPHAKNHSDHRRRGRHWCRHGQTLLELAALRTKQGLEDAKDQLKTLDAASQTAEVQQQRSTGQTLGLIGGLLAGSKSQTAQQYAQVAQQMSANTQAVDTQVDQQLALGKKYLADRDSIAIYQKHKGCSLR